MLKRHEQILEQLQRQQKVSVGELSQQFGVSEVTIRQDLGKLDDMGLLKRVHGGAMLRQSDDIEQRLALNFPQKKAIAQHAASLIGDGETVLIEGGSAIALLAQELKDRADITIITPSIFIAHELRESPVKVIVLGGLYQHESQSLVGPLTRLCLEQLYFTRAFIGIDGYHPGTGFTSRDMMRAEISRVICQRGAENIVLTDSTKCGQIHPNSLCDTQQISRVITDSAIAADMVGQLQTQGVQVEQV